MNLKFRVINLETGQVTYHNGIFNDKIDGNIRIDQYTGKHDIFGEEIYEGDTVTHRIYTYKKIKTLYDFFEMLNDVRKWGWKEDGEKLGFEILKYPVERQDKE